MNSAVEQDPRFPDDLDVWVLAGQSNMQGCGFVAEGLPPHPQVWCFTRAGRWALARDPLHEPWTSPLPVYRENEDTFTANMTRVPDADEVLAYGSGPAPVCSVTDEADMPLCAFQWPLSDLKGQ